jgi:quercetin dioxygenase-like cupin family protein
MKIKKHYHDVKPKSEISGSSLHEIITEEDGAPNFAMRVVEVEPGKNTRLHSHPWEHEVFIISGEAVVKGEKEETEITKDSVVYIAPNEQHCFVNKGKEPLRFV